MKLIHCRFDMLENFTLQLSSIKIGPAYEQNPSVSSQRKMRGGNTPPYRTIARLDLPQTPEVGQIYSLDGHPYIVHEISWATSQADNPDLHAYISLVDVAPNQNPLRKNVDVDCCDEIGEDESEEVAILAEVEELSREPQPSTAIDYDAKHEELRKTLYELAGKFSNIDYVQVVQIDQHLVKFAAESSILGFCKAVVNHERQNPLTRGDGYKPYGY